MLVVVFRVSSCDCLIHNQVDENRDVINDAIESIDMGLGNNERAFGPALDVLIDLFSGYSNWNGAIYGVTLKRLRVHPS